MPARPEVDGHVGERGREKGEVEERGQALARHKLYHKNGTVRLGKPYQEHERREEEEPEVVRFTVRERGLFEHAAIAHAVLSENMRHK